MKLKPLPSQGCLLSLIDYDQATGAMVWKRRPVVMFKDSANDASCYAAIWNTRFAGKAAARKRSHDCPVDPGTDEPDAPAHAGGRLEKRKNI